MSEDDTPRRRARRLPGGNTKRDKAPSTLTTKVRTARKRSNSSARWLQRQLNDPYVRQAQAEGYRSRSAYKLKEIDDKYAVLSDAGTVLDLGAAPGGWLQVALERGVRTCVGVDLLALEPLPGVHLLQADLREAETLEAIRERLGGKGADLVLSDMAADTTGVRHVDQDRTEALADIALEVAQIMLRPGGHFVCKVFQGGAGADLLARLKAGFAKVRHVKPPASRDESPELYLVALHKLEEKPS
jgi:23S rRNA (uridine2552-2'-O)-methyltransferase